MLKENNIIWFGLKGVTNVNDKLVEDIINNRPYSSIKDFYQKVKPTKTAMISLIKGGAFDEIMERRKALVWFLWETCDKKSRLTLQNMPGLIRYNILPKEDKYELPYRIYEFNRYLKAVCGKDLYILDERALNFLSEIDCLEESNSFSKEGINVHISFTFSFTIPAACSLPPEVMNSLQRGYKIQRHINTITDKNDLLYARGKTMYTYLYRIAARKKTL